MRGRGIPWSLGVFKLTMSCNIPGTGFGRWPLFHVILHLSFPSSVSQKAKMAKILNKAANKGKFRVMGKRTSYCYNYEHLIYQFKRSLFCNLYLLGWLAVNEQVRIQWVLTCSFHSSSFTWRHFINRKNRNSNCWGWTWPWSFEASCISCVYMYVCFSQWPEVSHILPFPCVQVRHGAVLLAKLWYTHTYRGNILPFTSILQQQLSSPLAESYNTAKATINVTCLPSPTKNSL